MVTCLAASKYRFSAIEDHEKAENHSSLHVNESREYGAMVMKPFCEMASW